MTSPQTQCESGERHRQPGTPAGTGQVNLSRPQRQHAALGRERELQQGEAIDESPCIFVTCAAALSPA